MRTLVKLLLFIVIIAFSGLISLPFFIDPNDYKQEISDQVEKATGRKLTLEGDIGLSVFPWIALELGPLSLSNAKGFKAEYFAEVDAAEIRIKLMPLLSKQLEMDTVILDGLVLNLEKNKAGKTNWDDLAGDSTETNTTKKSDTQASDTGTPALAAVSIAGVKLTNANILWSDATTAQNYRLENLNLTTDPLVAKTPTAVDIDFNLVSVKPDLNAHVTIQTKVIVDIESQQYALTELNFTTHAQGKDLPLPEANIVLTSDISIDLNKQTASLVDLVVEVQDLILNGDINANKILSQNPGFTGQLGVKPFNLRKLANSLAIELPTMSDDSTLEFIQLTTKFEGSTSHFNAKQLDLTLDQSQLSGQMAITNFTQPAITFNLALDDIDVDRYMPPVADEKQHSVAPPATAATAGAAQLPLETLRQINAKGTLDIGKLKISGTHSENIHLEINADKGLIKLHPMSADLYQGQYQGNVGLDARGKTLKLSINENLKGVQAGPLLKDMTGDDKISGIANAEAKLIADGATVEQMKQTLTGNGQFSFTNGALKGINIAESIRKAKAALKGETLPASDAPLQTDFSSLKGSFTATNGIINNQDLTVMSPLLRINGAGKVNLPKEDIDYGLKVSIVGTSKGQEGKELTELKGLTIPVNITGSFDNPKPTVDLASLFKQKATDEVKSKVTDKLKDKLGGDLGGLLGGVLGTENVEKAPEETADTTT
ncbi:MAG: AsmA family protein, partial [Gammaproteobacteria bacterium]|nr:AsmA family protein [Gammaproteobacteria bacterium]